MEFNAIINQAVKRLKPETTFRLINEARPNSDYLFNTFLPERGDTSFDASSASMTIRSTMAGLVAMDSPLPKGGVMEMSEFSEKIAKIGMELGFTERARRKLHEILLHIYAATGRGGGSLAANDVAIENLTNWYDKLIVQPQLDTAEWMRGQALLTGGIDWTYDGLELKVDYGVPAEAYAINRTGADGYGGTTSKFWSDIRLAKKYLRYNVKGFYAHPDTIDMIISNPDNKMEIVSDANNAFSLVKIIGDLERKSTDKRDYVTLTAYGLESEVLDPVNKGKTIIKPFLPVGKILAVGTPATNNFTLTAGKGFGGNSTDEFTGVPLGYTHIGPTIEGDGKVGRWGRVYTPEARPVEIIGQSVTNLLPVLEEVKKLFVLGTAMV